MTLNTIMTLKFKLVPFESLVVVSYLPSIVTMALSCIISETKRDIGRKSWFFHTPFHSTSSLGRFPSEYCHPVCCGKTGMVARWGYLKEKKRFWEYVQRCQQACDGQTDIQTSCDGLVRAMHRVARQKESSSMSVYHNFHWWQMHKCGFQYVIIISVICQFGSRRY